MSKNLEKIVDQLYDDICKVEPNVIFKVVDKEKQDIEEVIKEENADDIYVYLYI